MLYLYTNIIFQKEIGMLYAWIPDLFNRGTNTFVNSTHMYNTNIS